MRVHWLQHVPFEGLGSIEQWLVRQQAHVTATKFYETADLPSVEDLDVLIVMGGPMSVNDVATYPWLAAEQHFIRSSIERGVRVLGVCLGAQLIASAMGSRVYRNAEKEIGWWSITGTGTAEEAPPWARKHVDTTVFHWHGETFDLPPGATSLARSAACEHQAFHIGPRVLGIQFHLETTPELLAGMVVECADDLTPSPYVQTASEMLTAATERFGVLHQLMADTLDGLCREPKVEPADVRSV